MRSLDSMFLLRVHNRVLNYYKLQQKQEILWKGLGRYGGNQIEEKFLSHHIQRLKTFLGRILILHLITKEMTNGERRQSKLFQFKTCISHQMINFIPPSPVIHPSRTSHNWNHSNLHRHSILRFICKTPFS